MYLHAIARHWRTRRLGVATLSAALMTATAVYFLPFASAPLGAQARPDSAKAAARKDPKGDEIQQIAEVAQAKARGDATGRYLLQVGAFGGEAGANAAIDKVEAAGLRAFTEKIKTDRGDRVRVRVGPFPSRETAEQARTQLKAAGIEAAVIAP